LQADKGGGFGWHARLLPGGSKRASQCRAIKSKAPRMRVGSDREQASNPAYTRLNAAQQQQLLDFLKSI
jgi:hypothetical protein